MSEAIAVRGLTKSYNGKTVLRGLDLSVKQDRFLAFWAPTAREKHRNQMYTGNKTG